MKETLKNLLQNKLVVGIVVAVIVVFAITFPHTSKIKATSEFTGNYTVSYEKYFLHRLVETKTENVCIPGVVVRTNTITYGLDGKVDKIETLNCDSSSNTVVYSKDGYLENVENVSFAGNTIVRVTSDYNKNGQIIERETLSGPNTTIITFEYDDDNKLIKQETVDSFVGEVTETDTITYKNGNIETRSYENSEEGITAEVTCKADGTCELTDFTAKDYDITMNTTFGLYEVSANGKTALTSYASLSPYNVENLIIEAEGLKDTLLD